MKSKEEKIYTYIVLLIGIIITYFYFYHLRDGYSGWSIYQTYFSQFWRKIVGRKYDIDEGLFIFLQIFFLISWWYIRVDLVILIKIVYCKI